MVFQGFESKPTKSVTFDGTKVTYVGGDGAVHTAVLYTRIPKTAVTDDTTNDIMTFTVSSLIDDKDYKFSIEYNASNPAEILDMNVYEGSDTTPTIQKTGVNASSVDFDLSDYGTSFTLQDFNEAATDYVAKIFFKSNDVSTVSSDTPYSVGYASGVWTVTDINGETIKVRTAQRHSRRRP